MKINWIVSDLWWNRKKMKINWIVSDLWWNKKKMKINWIVSDLWWNRKKIKINWIVSDAWWNRKKMKINWIGLWTNANMKLFDCTVIWLSYCLFYQGNTGKYSKSGNLNFTKYFHPWFGLRVHEEGGVGGIWEGGLRV